MGSQDYKKTIGLQSHVLADKRSELLNLLLACGRVLRHLGISDGIKIESSVLTNTDADKDISIGVCAYLLFQIFI